MAKSTDYYAKKTLASWDQAAPVHAAQNTSLIQDVADPNFNNLNPDFNALIDAYGIKDRSAVQICCNNGIDLLSIKNKGAGRCLGIDGSAPFVEQAKTFAEASGHEDVSFIHSDIYDLPEIYQGTFEVAIITVGVFNWMPDFNRFMQICASLLTQGGVLFVEELHPILNMYEQGEPSYIDSSYFRTEPFEESDGLDYFSHTKYESKVNYWFPHSMSTILMGAISNGLQLEHVKELPYNVGNFCADLEFVENNPPLGINFAWRKMA